MNNSQGSGSTASIKVPSSATIEQSLVIQWPLPIWLTILLVVAVVVLVFWLYQSERGSSRKQVRWSLAALRTSLFLLVLWMMMGWSWQRAKVELPELVIAVDVSDSMRTADETAAPEAAMSCNRLQRAQQLLNLSRRQWQELQQRYRLKMYLVAEDAQAVDLSNQDWVQAVANIEQLASKVGNERFTQYSQLGDGIVRMIEGQAGRGTAAIVFLSDGIATSGETLKEAGLRARRSAIPVHTVSIGRPQARPDLRVGDILFEQQVFLGDQVSFEASILSKDLSEGITTKVKLLEVGSDRVLDEQSVELQPADSQANVTLRFEPLQPGQISVQIAVQPMQQETDTANNSSQIQLQVQDRVIRVLMVFSQPSYEFRYLKHFLERAKQNRPDKPVSFELTSILQSADTSYVQQDSTARRFVSSDPEELSKFDAFIFGPLDANMITRNSQQAILRAVTHGGSGCIFLGANEAPVRQLGSYPLGVLLPIEQAFLESEKQYSYEVEATKLGQSVLPVPLRTTTATGSGRVEPMTPLQSLLRVDTVKPGAQILGNAVSQNDGRSSPLIVAQFAGAGRTCFIATDETYRWTTSYGEDQAHQRFWGQILRWVSRGKLNSVNETELTVEPKKAQEGEPIRFQLRLPLGQNLPNEAEIKLTSATADERLVTLQRLVERGSTYQGVVDHLNSGEYRALLIHPALTTPPSVQFSIKAAPTEQADLRADQASMQELAGSSQGRAYLSEEGKRWFDNLPEGNPIRLGNLPAKPIWNQHWVALLFVILLTTEWLLRRRARML